MKYIFKNKKTVFSKLNKSDKIYLFLDYDGTLTPIVKRPELAVLSKKAKTVLASLLNNPKIITAIVSGRSIKQLKEKIKIKGVSLYGNHGFESSSSFADNLPFKAGKFKALIKEIEKKLKIKCKNIKGSIVENKGATLSVHFRLVSDSDYIILSKYIKVITVPYLKRKKIKITHGKKVVELRPPVKWNKGYLVRFLIKNQKLKNIIPMYIGDDKTDESAFKALGKRGISIFVGERNAKSNAQYYVKNVNEALKFLQSLSTLNSKL